jgi:hypothetical protein
VNGLGRHPFGAHLLLKSQPNDLLDGKTLCKGEPLRKGFSFPGQIDHVVLSPAANIPAGQRFFHGGGSIESAIYTLKRFDLFPPMCIILIDGKAKSKEADHGRDARAGQAIHQGCGRADGAGR